jgi:hypothetical protein
MWLKLGLPVAKLSVMSDKIYVLSTKAGHSVGVMKKLLSC